MIEIIFLYSLALIWLIFASVEDIKTTEISNWLNFSLIAFALAFRFFYALFELNNLNFFYQGIIGLVTFFIVGNLLYYGRMFAGGDAKLMIALGPIMPIYQTLNQNLKLFAIFLILFLISGAIYGLLASIIISLKNPKKFKKGFKHYFKKNKKKI